jgi:hypothetical protein
VILAAGAGVAVRDLWRREAGSWFIPGFLALSALGTMPGVGYRHYFAQLAPAVAIAGGYGLFALLEGIRARRRRRTAAILVGLTVLLVPVAMNRHYFLERDPNRISRHYLGMNPFPESKALADIVVRSTTPEDRVFIMGSEPQILLYAGRRSPASFPMMYPLVRSYPRYGEFQETVWREIQASPPKMILVMQNIPTSFLWDRKADLKFVDRVDNLVREKYSVPRVMLVSGLEGEWVGPDDSRLNQPVPCVWVCLRKPAP